MRKMAFILDWYEAVDPEERRRNEFAACTLGMLDGVGVIKHSLGPASRTGRSAVGAIKPVPFIRDIVDFGYHRTLGYTNDGILVLVNADTCVPPEVPDKILDLMEDYDCIWSHRVDVKGPMQRPLLFDEIAKAGQSYVGVDLFAFTRGWWIARCGEMPDALAGYEGWDFCMKMLMRESGFEPAPAPLLVYHEAHQSHWNQRHVIHRDPGQIYNRKICREWAEERGYGDSVIRDGRPYLFS